MVASMVRSIIRAGVACQRWTEPTSSRVADSVGGIVRFKRRAESFKVPILASQTFVRFRALSARHTPTCPEKACVGVAHTDIATIS